MKKSAYLMIVLVTLLAMLAFPAPAFAQNGDGGEGKFVFGGSYILASNNTLSGSLAVLGGQAALEEGSQVNGDVLVIGGSLTINGRVNGNVAIIGTSLSLGPNALITGDVLTAGSTTPAFPDPRIQGDVVQAPQDFTIRLPNRLPITWGFPGSIDPVGRTLWSLLSAFVLAVIAMVAGLVIPKPVERVKETITGQPVVAGAVGLLTAIIYPALLLVLAITIILSPVSLLGILLLIAALVLGTVALGLELGTRLAAALHQDWSLPVAAGIGTFLLAVVAEMAGLIACLNIVAWMLITLFGVGGVIMSRFGTQVYSPAGSYRTPPTPPTPPAEPVEPPASLTGGSDQTPPA